MTREFFGRLVNIFDDFRRAIDAIDSLLNMNLPIGNRLILLQGKFDVIMDLLDVQHTNSPLWVQMPLGEKIERMYLLCKAEYDSTASPENAVSYHRPIDLGDLSEKRI